MSDLLNPALFDAIARNDMEQRENPIPNTEVDTNQSEALSGARSELTRQRLDHADIQCRRDRGQTWPEINKVYGRDVSRNFRRRRERKGERLHRQRTHMQAIEQLILDQGIDGPEPHITAVAFADVKAFTRSSECRPRKVETTSDAGQEQNGSSIYDTKKLKTLRIRQCSTGVCDSKDDKDDNDYPQSDDLDLKNYWKDSATALLKEMNRTG